MKSLRAVLGALVLMVVATTAHAVPTISIAPTTQFGYLPLGAFGITPFALGDDEILNVSVPGFVYAGQSWGSIGIVSDGYVVIGGGTDADVTFFNTELPDPAAPRNILAPFWTDLDPGAGGGIFAGVLTDGVGSWLVIDWAGVPNWGDGATNNFEIWIGIDGVEDIVFAYGGVSDGDGGFLTVGANDINGLVGATYYFDGAGTLPVSGTELRVTTQGLPISTDVAEPATLALFGIGLLAIAAGLHWRGRTKAARSVFDRLRRA